MRSKSHTEIESVSQELIQAIVDDSGAPDNMVESAEATFVGLPNVDADPEARRIMQGIENAVGADRPPSPDGDRSTNGGSVADASSPESDQASEPPA